VVLTAANGSFVPIGDIACCKHLSKCSANRTRATLIFWDNVPFRMSSAH